ncbi:MAG: PilZ domain-containing protein [Nitrospirae bacterium]|nr:PilZ domain-containing protein [Nitrospirota bacterium]
MQKRRQRTFTNIKAELITGVKNYEGYIMNLSDDGIYVETAPTNTATDFIPGNSPKVKFKSYSGETLILKCEVEWLHVQKAVPDGLINRMGLEIIDPPQAYRDLFVFETLK